MARTQPVLLPHYCLSTNFTNQKMPLSETAPINPTKMLMMVMVIMIMIMMPQPKLCKPEDGSQ